MTRPSPSKVRKVKAWIIFQGDKRASPPITTATTERKVAVHMKAVDYLVIPCTITYEVPHKRRVGKKIK